MYTFGITTNYTNKILKCFEFLEKYKEFIVNYNGKGLYYSSCGTIKIEMSLHLDGDLEHMLYYNKKNVLNTYTLISTTDDTNFANYQDVQTCTYCSVNIENTMDFLYESSCNTFTVHDILSTEEMDEAMYEQLQFVEKPEVVHCQYVVSAMHNAGILGTFHQNLWFDVDVFLADLEKIYDRETRVRGGNSSLKDII